MCLCVCTHSVGVGLYGQGCIDREDFEEEGQLTLEGVFDLGAQASREVGDPLAQCGLCDPVVFNLGIPFWVGTHPQLEETAGITSTLRSDGEAMPNIGMSKHSLSVTGRLMGRNPDLTGKLNVGQ